MNEWFPGFGARVIVLLSIFAAWTVAPTPATKAATTPFSTTGVPASAALTAGTTAVGGHTLSQAALAQIQALLEEKLARTAVQQKIDSQLLYTLAIQSHTGVSARVPSLRTSVRVDAQGTILVDIKANVTSSLLQQIVAAGGQVINSFAQFQAIRARLPLNEVEALASSPDVKFIKPAVACRVQGRSAEVDTPPLSSFDLLGQSFAQHAVRVQTTLPSLIASLPRAAAPPVGAVTRSSYALEQGDICHRANTARTTFGVDGAGVTIGVMSTSVDYLSNSQAKGALGAVTVLPGQDGIIAGSPSGEGTAMLEIVHALAPGATLYFATIEGGPATFASNMLALRAAGCDIIVDDGFYTSESPFQDGAVAAAVASVTASGGLCFCAANNLGNYDSATSGTWEGDFVDAGAAVGIASGRGGLIHLFTLPDGKTQEYNTITSGAAEVDLFWADPLGGATDDYDLFVVNPTGSSVVASSTNVQNGTQDPDEATTSTGVDDLVVIVKVSGNACFMHLSLGTEHSTLQIGTRGSTRGHSCVPAAFCVAAVNVNWTKPFSLLPFEPSNPPNPFTGGAADPVETFSSDGPRQVFFNPDGSAITPGNFTHTGGTIRQKPDIAAADDVTTTVTGFIPFSGTSAAAPHAAAIAALMLSANPSLTPAQIRSALTGTALDIMATGVDPDSGWGLVMAYPAVQSVMRSVILTSSLNPSSSGSSVTFTATVSAVSPATGTPTGTVTFLNGTSALGTETLSNGSAAFSTSGLSLGSHTITVSYSGDSTFNAAVSEALTQVVLQAASVVVTTSQNPSALGLPITFNAAVSAAAPGAAAPTGSVTFLDGTTTPPAQLGAGAVTLDANGHAALPGIILSSGSHTIIASYSGNPTFASARASVTQVVWTAWLPADVSVGADDLSRVLWSNPDGRAVLWALDRTTGNYTQGPVFGPFDGGAWQATRIACGDDGISHVLWNKSDGTLSLWWLSSDNTLQKNMIYGPFSGWVAADIAVGSDNLARILWTNVNDGRAVVWSVDANGVASNNTNFYGPYAGYTAVALACGSDGLTRLVWTNPLGIAAYWIMNAANQQQSFTIFGPYAGWIPTDIDVGSDKLSRILWTNTVDGRAIVWSVDANGNPSDNQNFLGPFVGYTATHLACGSDGFTRLMWLRGDGILSFWHMAPNNTMLTFNVYGPYF